jgi:hypothetical protein
MVKIKNTAIWIITFVTGSGLLTLAIDKLDIIPWAKIKNFEIREFLSKEISFSINLTTFLILLSLMIVGYFVVKRLKSNTTTEDSSLSMKYIVKSELRKFNSFEDKNHKLLYRWDVAFHVSRKPYVRNLVPFCTKHSGVPVKLMADSIGVGFQCPNCNTVATYQHLKIMGNQFESELLYEWDKLNP